MTFTVAIVGRPNVGKSTLFNRLTGKRLALVDDRPGLTRDWRQAEAHLADLDFQLIDTAGLDTEPEGETEEGMQRQTTAALARADVALFLIDARAGVTPLDRHFAQTLRRGKVPVVLVANKCEGRFGGASLYEAFELGMGDPVPISAEHGEGLADLHAALAPYGPPPDARDPALDEADDEDAPPDPDAPPRRIHLAIVGRPNAGKSTLMNALLGEQRVLTSPEPGTTRDAVSVDWDWEGQPFRLVDTAGMRRRARVVDSVERLSVEDTLRQIRLAQLVVLVLDAEALQGQPLDAQDLAIARQVEEEGRALVLAINKWDAVDDRKASLQRVSDKLQTSLNQLRGIESAPISALKGRGLDQLMQAVTRTYAVWDTRVSTGRLNRFLAGLSEAHPAPLAEGRPNRLRYMTQVKARPPTFALWLSQPEALPDSYQRYIVNGLREAFAMPGVPIRLMLRRSRNPYAEAV